MADQSSDIREAVRKRYAAAATRASHGAYDDARRMESACCGGEHGCSTGVTAGDSAATFGAELYSDGQAGDAPIAAVAASLGCGVPTAVAELHEGETVLDLGSGAGADVLIAARRVSPGGRVYGLDMTDEMLELAAENQRKAGVENIEWLKGTIEAVPLPDASVDVVISNCVINLSTDKRRVISEAARVLRPGGRFAVTDVVADADLPDAVRRDMQQWTGCVAGALTPDEFELALSAAGLREIELRETHRVHEHAGSAIIRARKPMSFEGVPPRAPRRGLVAGTPMHS